MATLNSGESAFQRFCPLQPFRFGACEGVRHCIAPHEAIEHHLTLGHPRRTTQALKMSGLD